MNTLNSLPSIFDVNGLGQLKSQVKSDDPEALRAAAKQFEALFLQLVLKSMRDATPKDGLFDNDQSRMYESLLDQQLAQVVSSKNGVGLAAVIERQLSRKNEPVVPFEGGLPLNPQAGQMPLAPAVLRSLIDKTGITNFPLTPQLPLNKAPGVSERTQSGLPVVPSAPVVPGVTAGAGGNDAAADFVARVKPYALAVEQRSGIPAHFMVAQAALETGWGRSEPRFADGRTSFNVFGIKAGNSWKGATVEAVTTEYVNGQPLRQVEKFRAYGSYAEAFADYANLLLTSPRYSSAVASRDGVGFARAMQSAGYATDPQYAAKLERIMGSHALRGLTSA